MTCVPNDPRFRLLDHVGGWDAEHCEALEGLAEASGLRLEGGPQGIGTDSLDPFIPPPPLARGCGICDWYLAPRPAPKSAIKALDACANDWRPAWPGGAPVAFARAVAVAVDRHRLAVTDAEAGRVWILWLAGAQILAEIPVRQPRDVSFGPSGELVVVADDGTRLLRFGATGRPLGEWPATLPATPVARVAHDRDGRAWLAVAIGPDRFELYSQRAPHEPAFVARTAEELAASFERTAALRSDSGGFCLTRGAGDGNPTALCWDWFGHPLPHDHVAGATGASFATQGQLLTRALDSGIPRCVWHRLVVDADVPPGTRITVAVATNEDPVPSPQGVAEPAWAGFAVGRPHPSDWVTIDANQRDALIRCPAGRYLFIRLRLTGNGAATPHVRRLHIDFPRATSANLLPAVYREDPAAGDFTERFLSLFDASLGTVDAAVARFPALLDGARAHREALPWIARFLSVTLDETWDTATRRRVLAAAPALFRLRGTRQGLARSIRLVFGHEPAIVEHGLERAWGAVARRGDSAGTAARLGDTRLFSRKRARLTLGASPLGRTRVLSYGDPAADPHAAGAFRFTVAMPAGVGADAGPLARLVEGQKPAHTLATLSVGSAAGFRLGGVLRLGIDTLIAPPRPYVLGRSRAALARTTVLGGRSPPGPVIGSTALADLPSFCSE